jgi:hypothetical protein
VRVDRLGRREDDRRGGRVAEQVAQDVGEGGVEVHGRGHGDMVQGGWDIQSVGAAADG